MSFGSQEAQTPLAKYSVLQMKSYSDMNEMTLRRHNTTLSTCRILRISMLLYHDSSPRCSKTLHLSTNMLTRQQVSVKVHYNTYEALPMEAVPDEKRKSKALYVELESSVRGPLRLVYQEKQGQTPAPGQKNRLCLLVNFSCSVHWVTRFLIYTRAQVI